ncbi:transposase [Cupriavidus sp. WKF15]|uniref:transposase n=1 Tax=Cupriavidus sp. WKF15 TaxID=3032282 RepID=UPI0023E12EDA|nr:transposase [Cupriavidus sp. WKF15]WER48983.1 transposase [Cupriavidus sp. WKF15]
MARYRQAFKDRAIARMLPPESASVEQVAAETGISPAALERWRASALHALAGDPSGSGAARLDMLVAVGGLDEQERLAWCLGKGVEPAALDHWRRLAAAALAADAGGQPFDSRHERDQRRIRELERELRRKEQALAEAATLLVLPGKPVLRHEPDAG